MPIEKVVFVEVDAHPSCSLQEVEWVEGLAKMDPRIQGIVAHAQFTENPSVEADLDALASRPLVKGVRHNIQRNPTGWALQDSFIHGIKAAHRRGFHFELCVTHDQLAETIETVKRCREVSFVLDHCAKPNIKESSTEPWLTHMREMAQLPNVVCKISGLLTEADWERWTLEEVLWYAQMAAQAFGMPRIMFGSDWPVSEAAGGYGKWRDVVEALTREWNAEDQDKFFLRKRRRVLQAEVTGPIRLAEPPIGVLRKVSWSG